MAFQYILLSWENEKQMLYLFLNALVVTTLYWVFHKFNFMLNFCNTTKLYTLYIMHTQ